MVDGREPQIKVIVGLGNPGRRYERTRHNLGFEVVELLAGKSKFKAGNGDYFCCDIELGPIKIALLKPTTDMNRSGIAVADFALSENLTPEEILVIADDFNLPLGRIRLRESGSDGGHNGLASIVYHLNSENFPRIRMGIGPVHEGIPAEDFVLERFAEKQMADVKEMIGRASEAALMWLAEGYMKTAARFNRAINEN